MTPSTGSSEFPTYVALVPLEEEERGLTDELIEVAAALQIQVTRDLHPVWDVSAAVVPFATLDQVPPTYIPLTVTTKPLPLHRKGFHFSLQGLPFAVVEHEEGLRWSLAASHELLEMLCDPYGQRMVLAHSLEVAALQGSAARQSERSDRELFNYIVEVCDPCEYSTYTINDVVVSDFVTPKYYHVGQSSRGPYSFLNRIEKPLDVLRGGYISWRKYPPSGLIYQAISETDEAELRDEVFAGADVKAVPAEELKRKVVGGSSRYSIDAQRSRRGDAPPEDAQCRPPAFPRHERKATPQATLRADIEALLAWVTFQATNPGPRLKDVIDVVQNLVDKSGSWKDFNENPNVRQKTLEDLNIPLTHRDPSSRISIDTLRQVLDYLKEQRDAPAVFGEGDSVFGLWMAVQIG